MSEIAITGGSAGLRGYRAAPRRGSGPGVLVVAGAVGLDDATRNYCKRLADDDYLVVGAAPADLRDAYAALEALRADAHPADKLAVVALDAGAAIGVQLGQAGCIDALVMLGGGSVIPSPDAIRAVAIPVVVHAAGVLTAEAQARLTAISGRPNVRAFHYADVGKGFAPVGHAAFDRLAASLAHSRTLVVLRRVLGPDYDLAALFREHLRQEFVCQDADATMDTMVEQPYVNHIPTMTGGYGHAMLKRFYKYHFIPGIPRSRQNVILSEVVGADTVVLELLNCFTHDQVIDHILPGVPPTGKYVELPVVAIAKFKGDRLYYEHIYWDQASLLAQIGLLDPQGLPVAGREQAAKVRDPSLPANTLMASWASSDGKPL